MPVYQQSIITTRNPNQLKLLNAACQLPIDAGNFGKKTGAGKYNNGYDSTINEPKECAYCNHKFATASLGPGKALLTIGCLRSLLSGSAQSNLFRNNRKRDSHSILQGITVGVLEKTGCVCCCLCNVCTEKLKLFEERKATIQPIKKKKPLPAPVQLVDNQEENNDYVDDFNNDYDYIDNDGLAIGEIAASENSYIDAIYGQHKGFHSLLRLQNDSLFSLPRVFFKDNKNDDDVSEITIEWPKRSDGQSSALIFYSLPTARYVVHAYLYFFIDMIS